jgi:hypothetical protein
MLTPQARTSSAHRYGRTCRGNAITGCGGAGPDQVLPGVADVSLFISMLLRPAL